MFVEMGVVKDAGMPVDSFKWMPFSLAAWIRENWRVPDERASVPFTPLTKPVRQMKFSIVTTGGLYLRGKQQPFDIAREKQEPDWGDPSYRVIPSHTSPGEIAVAHLHYNSADIEKDHNVLFPLQRMAELAQSGEIGSLALNCYSVMGYRGHPGPVWGPWQRETGPAILAQMRGEGVEGVLLTPA
jgi:D-proline reductase (dithiol) PrdB